MPIPKPSGSETEKEFIRRCMANDKMISEYEDIDQRFAVCRSSYEQLQGEKHEQGKDNK